MTALAAAYYQRMDIRILVVVVAAALGAFLFVKARILFGGLDRAQLDDRRRRQRVFREMEDRAPS